MAVLRINGHTVPVELGTLRVETVEVGATNKAYDGSTLNLRYGFKRRISFTTTPLSEMEAFALEGLVQGQGEYWSFDGNSTLEYLYSSRGVAPTVTTYTAQTSTNKFGGFSLDPGKSLQYPTSVVTGLTDFTINAWVSDQDGVHSTGVDKKIIHIKDGSGNNQVSLERANTADNIVYKTVSNSGTTDNITFSTDPWTGTSNFHMVTATFRNNPETGENCKVLYYNGASVGTTAATTSAPTLSNATVFRVGGDGTSSGEWLGYIDDLIIVPYAATSDIVSAWYAMGKAMSPLPKVYVDGDVIPDDALTSLFFGYVKDSTYLLYAASSNNKRKLSITLEEA